MPDASSAASEEVTPAPIDTEDAKLVILARAARARIGAAQGAAVRDSTGRTYTASTVNLRTLRLSALQAAVAAAVSSGADVLEAAAVVGTAEPDDEPALTELGCPMLVVADASGTVLSVRHRRLGGTDSSA